MFFARLWAGLERLLVVSTQLVKLILLLMLVALVGAALAAVAGFGAAEFGTEQEKGLSTANLREIVFEGVMLAETVDPVLAKLKEAGEDDDLKGVLLVVDSPGGAVAPSIELAHTVQRLAEKKPVVVYGRGALTSGGYYASIWASKIVANHGAVLGSIGVISPRFDFTELMERWGIRDVSYHKGRYKGAGSPFREDTPEQRQATEDLLAGIYRLFVGDVAQARGLAIIDEDSFADGRVFLAAEALDLGLIDAVGDKYEAETLLVELADVEEPAWSRPSSSPLNRWLERISTKVGRGVVNAAWEAGWAVGGRPAF